MFVTCKLRDKEKNKFLTLGDLNPSTKLDENIIAEFMNEESAHNSRYSYEVSMEKFGIFITIEVVYFDENGKEVFSG